MSNFSKIQASITLSDFTETSNDTGYYKLSASPKGGSFLSRLTSDLTVNIFEDNYNAAKDMIDPLVGETVDVIKVACFVAKPYENKQKELVRFANVPVPCSWLSEGQDWEQQCEEAHAIACKLKGKKLFFTEEEAEAAWQDKIAEQKSKQDAAINALAEATAV